ncbi:acyltransferase [Desulfomicrobium sp. ZS1]|uniref:acyltransferase n=1 Tax=Desulfomicrobium sp. ZS1 TaxID=2952228 RepID=UPI0020B309AA|nr:acyltransferase [Desulfomicrobium sp. ZS1]UTF50095.1 acyltransferase [Desulfomicrobium sp. ZS1]
MNLNNYVKIVVMKIKYKVIYICMQYPRIVKYNILSSCKDVIGKPNFIQPVMIVGKGKVFFGTKVSIGVCKSPFCYSGYTYIEARNNFSVVKFGNNVVVNNNCSFISERDGILIGDNVLIGTSCEFIDSDFHELDPDKRMNAVAKKGKVVIGNNVFLGSNVKVMKNVIIGDNSVVANGSVVTKSIPKNVIAGGNPAKILRNLQ